MVQAFQKEGIAIAKVYHCPHHPDISGACDCRKPKPGMLLEAAKEFDVDLKNSLIIGDKERDIEAGLNAGLRETYLFDECGSVAVSKATKIVKKLDEIWK
jgi:D-glycero-D-manno-heptose 1,7-bisphosphate phosphatase